MANPPDLETVVRHWMQTAALGVEVLAVAVIVVAIAPARQPGVTGVREAA